MAGCMSQWIDVCMGPPQFSLLTSAMISSFCHASLQVLRLDRSGRVRQVFARRRDLLREHKLQPRDLRRIDPSVDINKTPPSITIKDSVIVICLGGVRWEGKVSGGGGR